VTSPLFPDRDASAARSLPHQHTDFAHNSERQFAKLLDFYGIEWAYEPTTFILEKSHDGRTTHAFSPDFYLPDFDLYLEITTQRQRLVTKKNRKVRLLQERYPEVKITVLYQRHYLALLVKYGLESPSQLESSGGDDPDDTVGGGVLSFLPLEHPVSPPDPLTS